jgi:hypothetical protein
LEAAYVNADSKLSGIAGKSDRVPGLFVRLVHQ